MDNKDVSRVKRRKCEPISLVHTSCISHVKEGAQDKKEDERGTDRDCGDGQHLRGSWMVLAREFHARPQYPENQQQQPDTETDDQDT